MEDLTRDNLEIEKESKKEQRKRAKQEKKAMKKEKTPMDKAKKKKIRKRIIIGVIIVAVIVMYASCALGGGGAIPVTTVTASKGEIEEVINTSGTVSTGNVKNYFSDVTLKVGEVKVEAGDAVKAGDVLMVYDADDLSTQKQLAELKKQSNEGNYLNAMQSNNEKVGDLQEADFNLEVLEQQIADAETCIKALEDKIAKKKSDLAYFGTLLQIEMLNWKDKPDSDEYKNIQTQIQINSYEQTNHKDIKGWEAELEEYNKMLAEYKEYKSEMKSQQTSAEAGKMTSGAKSELEANNESSKLESEKKLVALAGAESGVVADFDGVVTAVKVVEGATLTEGAELFVLESTEDVFVKISVTKYDLDKIQVGQKATVTIGANTYEGEVSKINKMAEKNETGAAVVGTEVKILNPDSEVYLGVEAKVVISTAQEKDVILAPVSAVNVDMDGEFVYVIEEGLMVKKPVVTGISSDTMVQIVEGVTEGTQLITNVTAGLTEGMPVMALPQETQQQ